MSPIRPADQFPLAKTHYHYILYIYTVIYMGGGVNSIMLEHIIDSGLVWHGQQHNPNRPGLSTGFPTLDRVLPSKGWPKDGVIELLSNEPGAGDISLLLPMLAQVSQNQLIIFVAPPYLLHGPTLIASNIRLNNLLIIHPGHSHHMHWSVEQSLQSECCGAVLYWPKTELTLAAYRRLQILSNEYQVPTFMLLDHEEHNNPCSLRLHLTQRKENTLLLNILKCKGRWGGERIKVQLPIHHYYRYPLYSNP